MPCIQAVFKKLVLRSLAFQSLAFQSLEFQSLEFQNPWLLIKTYKTMRVFSGE